MSAVARDQSMSPSAVSQQLAQLERETKVSLLKNAGRGVALTDAGVQLARRAHEMLALAETAQAELSASRGETAGVLLALVAAFFWGLYVLSSARVGRLVPGQDGLAVAMAVGALAVLPLGSSGALTGLMDPRLLALAAATGLLASVLPYTLELSALRR